MNLKDIYENWEQDSKFERDLLTEETLRIPRLHSKYLRVLSEERIKLKGHEAEYKKLFRVKHEYYRGDLDQDTLKAWGWEQNPLKILRQDLDMYIQQDEDIITINNKISLQKEKISLVESILHQINNRGYQIKSIIDWERFKEGLN
ncbi:MAG: recombination mediator protein UvsY [Candidatus Poseidoniales archaeon]